MKWPLIFLNKIKFLRLIGLDIRPIPSPFDTDAVEGRSHHQSHRYPRGTVCRDRNPAPCVRISSPQGGGGCLAFAAPVGGHERFGNLGATRDQDQGRDRQNIGRHQEQLVWNALDHGLKAQLVGVEKGKKERAKQRLAAGDFSVGKEAPLGAIAHLRNIEPASSGNAPSATEYERLPIKDGGHTYLVPHADIDWIDAAGDYMCVHAQGKVHILRSTMKDLEAKLSAEFVRIHRSTIVNVRKVRAVDTLPKGECLLHLDVDVTVRVSRNYRSAIQKLLN